MKKIMLFTVAVAFLFGCSVFAADKTEAKVKDEKKTEKTVMTKEVREKEAKMHEEMVTCLRSDKPAEECHEAMVKTKKMLKMTPELRTKKAKMHEEMASCLRSDKNVADCHEAMMKSCKEIKGDEGTCGEKQDDKHKKMHDHE